MAGRRRWCAIVGLTIGLTIGLTSTVAAGDAAGKDWPQWRGPTRDGRVAESPAWPNDLKGLKQVWRVELGPSYSGPLIVGDRIFVTETRDKKDEVVYALDRATGRTLWTTEWPGAMSVSFIAKKNGDWIRATPACDGERLYVAGMRDLLVCLDANTGEKRWSIDFVEKFKTDLPSFGFVSSPLIVDDSVYVQAGGSFVRLDKITGEVRWRTLVDGGGMMGSAFASPVHATLCGTPQFVVQTRTELTGVAPEDGKVLWRREIPAFRGMNIWTPVIVGDRLFVSAYGGKSLGFELAKSADSFGLNELWENKAQGYMSTPVVVGDFAYVHLRNQRAACLNLKDGTEAWRSKAFGEYWSLVLNRDRVLALDQRGELLLLDATPKEFTLLDTKKIADAETWGHLAVTGREIVIRELKAVAVYRWE
ncbi:MAG: hypothetical protein AMXMBFR47_21680 [Planctomycetota bacterium]